MLPCGKGSGGTTHGLRDTSVELTAERSARKASGYAADGTPTPDWHLPTFAGAGALYSTADDQVRYLRAMLGRMPARLRPALGLVQQPEFTPPNLAGVRLALAWNLTLLPISMRTMVWHNGETGGFTTFTGFCPETRTAVTALANIATSSMRPPRYCCTRSTPGTADRWIPRCGRRS